MKTTTLKLSNAACLIAMQLLSIPGKEAAHLLAASEAITLLDPGLKGDVTPEKLEEKRQVKLNDEHLEILRASMREHSAKIQPGRFVAELLVNISFKA